MKKILYTIMALAISAFALQSCEDVPEPYTIPGQETGGGEGNITEPAGDGTVATPFNVAAALDVCAGLQQSSTSASYLSEEVYVKGKVSSIVDTEFNSQYGNITYYISDMKEDGTTANQLEVYRGYGLNGAKFTSLDDIKVGDEVIVKGKLQNWLGTYEFTQGSELYSLNGTTAGDTPAPEGNNLLVNGDFETWDNGAPNNWKTTSTAGNATLTQSSDAHNGSYSVSVGFHETQNKRLAYKETTLKAGTYRFSYYAKATTTNKTQTRGGYVPVTNGSVGDYVYSNKYVDITNSDWTLVSYDFTLTEQTPLCLVVMNVKTSNYATAQELLVDDASLVTSDGGIVEGGDVEEPSNPDDGTTTTGGVTIDGTTVTLTNSDVTEGTETSVLVVDDLQLTDKQEVSGPYAFPDGTTITLAKGDGRNNPTFYSATHGFRVYAKNTIVFNSTKTIAKVIIECDEYSGTKYVGNATATFGVSGNTATYCNDFETNSGGVQLRPKKFTIYYAK